MASERDIPVLVPSSAAGTDDAEDNGDCHNPHDIVYRHINRYIVRIHNVQAYEYKFARSTFLIRICRDTTAIRVDSSTGR